MNGMERVKEKFLPPPLLEEPNMWEIFFRFFFFLIWSGLVWSFQKLMTFVCSK